MLPRSAANATKPASYRQHDEAGHSPARLDHGRQSDEIPVTDWTQAHLPRKGWCAVDRYRNGTCKRP